MIYLHQYLLRLADGINLPQVQASGPTLQHMLQIAFGVAGALALLFIVISGFRYIVSAGNPEALSKAKNGLVYAIVGLIVVILAEVIVTFVIGEI